jgi:hypothetical protein
MMEDNDEEENDDNYPEFPKTIDTAMEDNEEEEEGEERASDVPADDLGQVIVDAQIDCESEKEREKLERMLDDHKKGFVPKLRRRPEKARKHTRIAAMESREWFI